MHLPVSQLDDFIKGKDDFKGLLDDRFFLHILAVFGHNAPQQPQCLQIFYNVARAVGDQHQKERLNGLVDIPHRICSKQKGKTKTKQMQTIAGQKRRARSNSSPIREKK